MHKLALACLFATTSVFLFREGEPLPVQDQHHFFDIDFDEDFQLPSGAHHRATRRTGRGNSLDTWACETVIPLPNDIRAEFPLDAFYQKYTHAYGIPIISSEVSQNASLIRACYTVRFLLADRKDIRDAMFDQYGRVGVIAFTERTTEIPEHSHLSSLYDDRARGLGGVPSNPISTNAEENLLCEKSRDRWFAEDVLVHEFAHAIHLISLNRIDSSFSPTLRNIYDMAKAEDLFPNTYAISKRTEYFAEAVQTFFNVQTCSYIVDNVHNDICRRDLLKEYDPRLYNLVAQVFPCMNILVDRCEANQSLAANQELQMNCDVSVTTVDTITTSATEGTQTAEAGTTSSSTHEATTSNSAQEATTSSSTQEATTSSSTQEATTSSSTHEATTSSSTQEANTSNSAQEATTSSSTQEANTSSSTHEVTTSSSTKTSTENVKQEGKSYRVTILIVVYKSSPAKFTNDLKNSLSVEFLAHQTRIEILLNKAFSSQPGFMDAVVLTFFNGSIGVEAAVTYDPTSTVTQADVQRVIVASNPFNGSDYKADLNKTIVQQVCVAGFCYNGGTCEPSAEKYPRNCECPFGFDGDRCEIQPVTVKMATDHVPARSNTIVILIIVIPGSVTVIVIFLAVVHYSRVRQGKKHELSTSGVELRGVKYSKGSKRFTT